MRDGQAIENFAPPAAGLVTQLPEKFDWNASGVQTNEAGEPVSCNTSYYAAWQPARALMMFDPTMGSINVDSDRYEHGEWGKAAAIAGYNGKQLATAERSLPRVIAPAGWQHIGWYPTRELANEATSRGQVVEGALQMLPQTFP